MKLLRQSLERLLAAGFDKADWIVGRAHSRKETSYQFRGDRGDRRIGFVFVIDDQASDKAYHDAEAFHLERAEAKLLNELKGIKP